MQVRVPGYDGMVVAADDFIDSGSNVAGVFLLGNVPLLEHGCDGAGGYGDRGQVVLGQMREQEGRIDLRRCQLAEGSASMLGAAG